MINVQKILEEERLHFVEEPVKPLSDEIKGWHSSIFEEGKAVPSAGGTSTEKRTARRIALAEFLERKIAKSLNTKEREKLLLDKYSSSSGFACGFHDQKTMWRAISEGIERWAFSQWIDEKRSVLRVSEDLIKISPLGKVLLTSFKSVHYFTKSIPFVFGEYKHVDSFNVVTFEFRVFLGETENGIFCGSRVQLKKEAPWEHEIVEAHRNLVNYKLMEKGLLVLDGSWFLSRVKYFGNNKGAAIDQINKAVHTKWPAPEIELLGSVNTKTEGVYLWRSLFKNYLHWSEGPVTRFVI